LPGDSRGAKPQGWLVGGSIGLPVTDGIASPDLFTLAVHWTQLRPGRLGADFALGTMPRVITAGAAVGLATGGVALPLQLSPGVLLLPSAGVTLAGVAAVEGSGGTTGLNAGLSAVIFGAGSVGVRSGVTWHRVGDTGASTLLWELGMVRIPRPR